MLAVHGQSVAREDDDLGRSSHLCVSDSLAVCYRQEPKSPLPQLDTSTFFFSVLFLVYNVYTKIVNTSRELNHFIRQTVCRFPSKDFKYITVPCLSLLTSWLRMRFTISFWCLWCREESKKIMRRSIVGKNEGERTSHRVGLVWKWNPHIFISMKRVQFRYWRLTRLFLGIHLEMQLESSPSSTCVKQNNNVPPPPSRFLCRSTPLLSLFCNSLPTKIVSSFERRIPEIVPYSLSCIFDDILEG